MISTLRDLKAAVKATATGDLISPGLQRQRLNAVPMPQSPLSSSYGLGILDIMGFLGHSGAIYGYGTSAYCLPDADATIVVVTNGASNSFEG